MSKDRRVQILVESAQYERLERFARASGRSVAAVIRDAVDRHLPVGGLTPAEAGARLLDAPPVDVGEWEDVKATLLDELTRRA